MMFEVIAYAVGSVLGFYFGYKMTVDKVTVVTIDALIEQGYLKFTRNRAGEIEVLKWNEEKN